MAIIDTVKSRILSGKSLERMLAYWRFKDLEIVFTNGCFDILHRGHADYLARAAGLGDILVVGLNTDRSVRALKGPGRPLQDQKSRSLVLASLSFVDAVILFDTDTPAGLIKQVRPSVLVKGGDYRPEDIVGYDDVTSYGGRVVTLDLVEGYSTTNIAEKMTKGKAKG